MNLNPAKLLNPIFNALDALIENDGVYLYLVFVWLVVAVIAWIFSGGLRKRMKGNSATVVPGIIITMQPSGEISRPESAPCPGNGRAVATAAPPNVRRDNSQGNLCCAGNGRAMSTPETREMTRNTVTQQPRAVRATVKATSRKTTRSNLNHDIQNL